MSKITVSAETMRHALTNVNAHTGDPTLPALAAVRVESDGQTVTLVATDRYVMAVETVTAEEPGDTFAALIDTADVARIVALCKTAPRGVRSWPFTIDIDGDTLTFTVPGQSLTTRTVLAEFPRWATVLDAAKERALDPANSVEHAAYDPALIAKFGKVKAQDGRAVRVMRMHFGAVTKPAYVELGDTFRAVLMPQRVEWPESMPRVTNQDARDVIEAARAS